MQPKRLYCLIESVCYLIDHRQVYAFWMLPPFFCIFFKLVVVFGYNYE